MESFLNFQIRSRGKVAPAFFLLFRSQQDSLYNKRFIHFYSSIRVLFIYVALQKLWSQYIKLQLRERRKIKYKD